MTVYDYHITMEVGSDMHADPDELRRLLKRWARKHLDGYSIEIHIDTFEIPPEEVDE